MRCQLPPCGTSSFQLDLRALPSTRGSVGFDEDQRQPLGEQIARSAYGPGGRSYGDTMTKKRKRYGTGARDDSRSTVKEVSYGLHLGHERILREPWVHDLRVSEVHQDGGV